MGQRSKARGPQAVDHAAPRSEGGHQAAQLYVLSVAVLSHRAVRLHFAPRLLARKLQA